MINFVAVYELYSFDNIFLVEYFISKRKCLDIFEDCVIITFENVQKTSVLFLKFSEQCCVLENFFSDFSCQIRIAESYSSLKVLVIFFGSIIEFHFTEKSVNIKK